MARATAAPGIQDLHDRLLRAEQELASLKAHLLRLSAAPPSARAAPARRNAGRTAVARPRAAKSGGQAMLTLTGPRGANAQARRDGEAVVVLAGSTVARTLVASAPAAQRALRDRLLADKVLVRRGKDLCFAADHRFLSASAAASVVMGRNANGRTAWRDASGKPLAGE